MGVNGEREMAVERHALSPHFCKGHLTVAFVFSAPGREEERVGKPVAGATGENLESALAHLHSANPGIFPSEHRYDYRLSNAVSEPFAVALGHRASEARDAQVREHGNVRRVLRELEGCTLVVLSGNKAMLLAQAVRASGKTVIEVPHVGNKALNATFAVPDGLKSASDRRASTEYSSGL
jgi:uracil-DNA glycosylase